MSSGRESVGDLIPQDLLEVFAQERQSKRGRRSRRRNRIIRAFSWFNLKGRRRKNLCQNKDINIDILTPGLPVPIPQPSTNTASEVEDKTSRPLQQFQENVFIEGNRPKYVEDLHTEAQEGLKLLQQDENRNGVDYQDDQSVISTVTARTDDDMSFSELGMSESESTAADTISTRSITSYQSSRSGLTRQGSTFRPLKEDKKHGKSKSKGKKAGMVTGIPRHVQRELGLDRAAWTASQFTDAQLSNGGVSISTVIPTLDSISIAPVSDEAIKYLQNMNSLQAEAEDKPPLPPQAGPQDDLFLLRHFLNQSFDPQRQNSLAVPGMTTSGISPSNPVMYVSPEATYMSKIIPNAILPSSVDVVELSRNRSRSSVRMVSKSSLASASPAPSRASSRASSRFSSRAPSLMSSRISSRASTCRTATLSECSGWSRSGSSETLVSDSSTISSSSTPRVASRTNQAEDTDGPPMRKGNPGAQNTPFKPVKMNGNDQGEEAWKESGSTGPFNRNLSVMKKSKKPPPPPSRSYSLHSRSYARTIAEHKSLENGSQKVESPYGAYSSQNGNTAVPSKENLTSQRAMLAELQLKKALQMHTGNMSYADTNGRSHQNNLKHFLPSIKSLTANGVVASPAVKTLMALLDVPDPPKVLAPPPPPPETWAHNQLTFELLCGPGPANFERWAQKRGLKFEIPIQMAQGEIPATSQARNLMKDDIVAPEMQTQEAMASDKQSRTTPTKISVNVHPAFGYTLPLTVLTHVRPSPSPSPPPEHIPPLPPTDLLKEDSSAQCQGPFDEIMCLPPHPLYPPPPPPTNVQPPHPPGGQDETDLTSLTMPPSLRFLLKVPPVTQDAQPSTLEEAASSPPQKIPSAPPMVPPAPPMVPPAPPMVPPAPPMVPPPPTAVPPPPPAIPPAPPLIPPSPKTVPTAPKQTPPDISSKQAQITSTPFTVPPPPPLPVDLKKEVKTITVDKQEKQSSPPTTQTGARTEESPTLMVTPSLLQKVRLRSIKINVSQAEAPGGLPKPTHQTKPKPMRRSLILSTPDIPSQSATDQKNDPLPATTVQENQGTNPPSDTQPKAEPRGLSGSAEQVSPGVEPEPNSQVSITDPKTQQASTEPVEESVSAESLPQNPNKAEPEPKITVQDLQNATPESSTMLTPAEPKDQPVEVKEIQNDSSKTKDKENPSLVQPEQDVKPPKPETLILTPPKFNPAQKVPPTSIPSSSMSLQDAIRLKTAAMSSTDNQAKRLSLLLSPPVSTGAVSPTSTANFIFSKSTKKVVIEKSPSSPESKSDLRKTLVYELNSVSQTSRAATDPGTGNAKAKVPPPVAKKPSAKSENITHNSSESNVDTEHVQTAGQ
ncbi:uncharacterized protein KIAA1522 homolog [Ictalurus punctatus]|uniref:Uncharacterized protein KIAA1522 homolog n=1 Tax=Ictalurus punctatus TaxID=7998 RepID=A0A2D0QN09_ICTPU|nr:uncharacterized protein KIAA1522 homolog [Ictalurus punctatus]XP_017318846.1 uncharacterized protein KIAA1522 homolog [Ictalurus punctatus]